MKIDKYTIESLTEIGIDYRKLNKEQIDAIMFPEHAPENYYQDGEIGDREADYLHSQRLIQCGVVGEAYKKAWKLVY